mgnify:CR=1 FL=1
MKATKKQTKKAGKAPKAATRKAPKLAVVKDGCTALGVPATFTVTIVEAGDNRLRVALAPR